VTPLTAAEAAFLAAARTATMATVAPDGRPRLVPICLVLSAPRNVEAGAERPVVYTPLDEKPKRTADARSLARVRDLLVLPEVTLLAERWDEDWTRLAWLRAYGTAELLEPESRERSEHTAALAALREKYPQYRDQRLEERPVIRILVTRTVSWGAL
jgi:PPOX class probable F420-dependent enzyme